MKSDEICFEAPEINTALSINIDANVSVVTVAKLVDISVKGGCVCPDGSSGISVPKRSFSPVRKAVRDPSPPRRQKSPERKSEPKSDGGSNFRSGGFSGIDMSKYASTPTIETEPVKVARVPTPEPIRVPTPEPVRVPTPEPIRVPTPEPVRIPTPEPVRVPTPEPIKRSKTPPSPKQISKADSAIYSGNDRTLSDSLSKAKSFNRSISGISDASFSEPLLTHAKELNLEGTLNSKWKQENILGKFVFSHEDRYGRPIYMRKDLTSSKKSVYLYHLHESKKWRVGPDDKNTTCWLFITSKVPRPELIDKDASAKNRSWYEHSGGEWLPVKDMKIAVV